MKTRLVSLALALALPSALEAHKPTKTRFTYHKDVYPIFERRCGSCHKEGGAGPMSLLRYKDTFPWAVSIKNQVLALSMPPWFADERYGSFRHSGSLTAAEVDTIVDWCLGGAPEGSASGGAAPPGVSSSPSMRDLELALPEPFVLAADRGEARHEALLATDLRADRVLRSIEFRPEHPSVVRSALFFVVPKGGTPGAPAATWIAGEGAEVWPSGTGLRFPANASLLVRIHYKKTWLEEGKEIRDRSAVAISFATKKTEPVESIVVGARETHPIPRDVELLSILPSFESSPEFLSGEAVLPDGTTRPLIRLRNPDPSWPRTYWLEKPLALPKGTRLRVTAPDTSSFVFSVVRSRN
jgi:hypothetical protein